MKKILSMILVLVMVFACVGCTGESADDNKELNQKTLKGTWEVSINMQEILGAVDGTGMFGDLDAEYMKEFQTDAVLTAYLVLDGEETLVTMVNADDFIDAAKRLINDLFDFLKDGAIYDMMAEEGVDEETFNEMLSESGMTVNDYIDAMKEMFNGMLTKDVLLSGGDNEVKGDYLVMNTATYKLDGNKIYLSEDQYVEVTYDGADMTIVKVEAGEDETLAGIENVLPLTVKRISDKVNY